MSARLNSDYKIYGPVVIKNQDPYYKDPKSIADDDIGTCKQIREWGWINELLHSKSIIIRKVVVLPQATIPSRLLYHTNENWTVVAGVANILTVGKGDAINFKNFQPISQEEFSISNPGSVPLTLVQVVTGIIEQDISL